MNQKEKKPTSEMPEKTIKKAGTKAIQMSSVKARALYERQYRKGGMGGWGSFKRVNKDIKIVTESWQCVDSDFSVTQTRMILEGKTIHIVGLRPELDGTVVAIGIESPPYSQIEIYTDILTDKGKIVGIAHPTDVD